jgi:hypothetical protein
MSYYKPCNSQVEYVISITLKLGEEIPVSFNKTGHGESKSEAEADATNQLNEDKYYQFLKEKGAKVIK